MKISRKSQVGGGKFSRSLRPLTLFASAFILLISNFIFTLERPVYATTPTVASISPNAQLPITGGTEVTIEGSGFLQQIPEEIKDVVTNDSTTYVITTSGQVYAWGAYGSGQTTPYLIPGLSNVAEIVTSELGGATYALTANGQVYAWGANNNGQIGNGTTINQATPYLISSLPNVERIVTSASNNFPFVYSVYALTTTGQVYSWGANNNGQIGNGTTIDQTTPYLISSLSNIEEIVAMAGNIAYALTSTGQVYAWGDNQRGLVGNGTTINQTTPLLISGLSNVKEITTVLELGDFGTVFALTTLGQVYAWGNNPFGVVGNGTTTSPITAPVFLSSVSNIEKIVVNNSGGQVTAYALTTSGQVYAWGSDGDGAIGNGSIVGSQTTPYLIPGLSDVKEIIVNIHKTTVSLLYSPVYALTATG